MSLIRWTIMYWYKPASIENSNFGQKFRWLKWGETIDTFFWIFLMVVCFCGCGFFIKAKNHLLKIWIWVKSLENGNEWKQMCRNFSPRWSQPQIVRIGQGEEQGESKSRQSIEAFFPEGTWCHRDTRQIDYYCQNRECKP